MAAPFKPGRWRGKNIDVVSVFEAVGKRAKRGISAKELSGIERQAIPRRRFLRRHVYGQHDGFRH